MVGGFHSVGLSRVFSLPSHSRLEGMLPRLHLHRPLDIPMKALPKPKRTEHAFLPESHHVDALPCVALRLEELRAYIVSLFQEFKSSDGSKSNSLQ